VRITRTEAGGFTVPRAIDNGILVGVGSEYGWDRDAALTFQHATLRHQAAKPSPAPASGYTSLYTKTGDGLYLEDSGGVEVQLADTVYVDAIGAGASSTGVLTGGLLTVNANTTLFDVASGTGQITQSGTTTAVAWGAKTAQTFAYVGVLTFVSIDSAGDLVLSSTAPTNTSIRANIFLGVLVHVDSVNIDTTNDQQCVVANPVNQLRDLFAAIGFLNIGGNVLESNSLLTVAKTLGSMLAFGANFKLDPNDPHVVSLPAIDTNAGGTFQYRMYGATSSALTLTSIDPTILDAGQTWGTGAAVANNQWTVQRVYSFTSNNLKIQPGQTEYGSQDAAIAAIPTQTFVTEPSIAANGLLIGYIVVKENATVLSDTEQCLFLQAGKFGQSASAVAGSGHVTDTTNPHGVTATQVGLGNVTNESKATMFTSPTFTGTVTGIPYDIQFAASDETTLLTTGTSKMTFRVPRAFTLTAVRASLSAVSDALITVDLNLDATTILSTEITIDIGEATSVTAATPPVVSTSAMTDDGIITVDLTVGGGATTGAGLKITMIGNL
jgi:hypothetical protein